MLNARSIASAGIGAGALAMAMAGFVVAGTPGAGAVVSYYGGSVAQDKARGGLTKREIDRQNAAIMAFVMAAMEQGIFE